MDLLTAEEEAIDMLTQRFRWDIDLLARRLVGIADWLDTYPDSTALNIGLFGSSTGAAAALIAAKERPELIHAVVSRGGRPDLADAWLPEVKAPTLLIVGGQDFAMIGLNEHAFSKLQAEKEFEIVPGATHLFLEPGALEKVAILAREWFQRHLTSVSAVRRAS